MLGVCVSVRCSRFDFVGGAVAGTMKRDREDGRDSPYSGKYARGESGLRGRPRGPRSGQKGQRRQVGLASAELRLCFRRSVSGLPEMLRFVSAGGQSCQCYDESFAAILWPCLWSLVG